MLYSARSSLTSARSNLASAVSNGRPSSPYSTCSSHSSGDEHPAVTTAATKTTNERVAQGNVNSNNKREDSMPIISVISDPQQSFASSSSLSKPTTATASSPSLQHSLDSFGHALLEKSLPTSL